MRHPIGRLPRVIATRVGYAGGHVANATCQHHSGHADAVEVIFDPDRLSHRELLEFFFQVHDPTTKDRQGNDIGSSYRCAIFSTTKVHKRLPEDTIADVDALGLCRREEIKEGTEARPSWTRSLSTRTTWSATPRVTCVTSCVPGGSSHTAPTARALMKDAKE